MNVPALVTLSVWGVEQSRIPGALLRMSTQRRAVRSFPGATFAKLLGTGSGETFSVRDSDPRHWALLTCWDAPQAAAAFEQSRVIRRWNTSSSERLRVELVPVASTGEWSGQRPFGVPADGNYRPEFAGAVAAITRARLRPSTAPRFWHAVPPVVAALHESAGLLLAIGVGEAPIGLQGTFSMWRSAADLTSFAYEGAEHRRAIQQTKEVGWYSEELFARFAVQAVEGTYRGQGVLVSP